MDAELLRAELIGELAEQEAFAAAGLGQEHGEALELDGEVQPSQRFFESAVAQQRFGRGSACEGMMVEAEIVEQLTHESSGWVQCASTRVLMAWR